MNTNDIALLVTVASFLLPANPTLDAESTRLISSVVSTIGPLSVVDPPRVRVTRVGTTRTVRHGNGQLLRGIAIGSYLQRRQQGESSHLSDPKYWADLKAVGINAIRLVAFDAWQRSHSLPGSNTPFPHTDLYDARQTADMLAEFDLIVDQAAAHGMAVMINYHDVGNYFDPDFTRPAGNDGQIPPSANWQYVNRFWNLVAPRYANRTHVFYELLNEPVQWTAAEYKLTDVRKFKVLVDRVRSFAPKTHIVICSFASHHTTDDNRTMRDVAYELKDAGVDFSNASLGFHPYSVDMSGANSSDPIIDLMKNFTVINTEQNFPLGLIPSLSDPDARGLDGDRFGVQSMERLGISWFHWNSDGPTEFRFNFRAYVIRDAKAKGYYWVAP